jgi:multidrug efflux pump subunit AcrA (membrane-fusion protein)
LLAHAAKDEYDCIAEARQIVDILYGKIHRGDLANVTPETPGTSFSARVSVVDRVIDAASGTFGVRLELPSPNNAIPAGAKCKVRFAK